ncbi:MAG: hypothetical protein WD944_11740 [Steroidobacteraceae bacterium]
MKAILLALATIAVATGCTVTRPATLVEFSTGEILHGVFTDNEGTGGTVQVTMPNGEILGGRYSAIRGTDEVTFTSATVKGTVTNTSDISHVSGSGTGTQRTVGSQGKAYALLTSTTPGSKLVMEIIVTYGVLDGHGFGDARTNDDRTYRVQF